jgi:nicotinamidase-related amidase
MTMKTIPLTGRYYRQYPAQNPLGEAEEALELRLDETAFLLVDVYGKGYDPGDNLGDVPEMYAEAVRKSRDIVVDHIRPARDAADQAGMPIIYLTNYLAPSTNAGTEWRNMSIRTCGVDVLESWPEPNDIFTHSHVIAPRPGDHLIKKQMYSGFFETHLESLLSSLRIRNLVAVGFDLRICLGTTLIDAMYRNYRVVLLRDCTSTGESPETREGGWMNWTGIRFIEANVGYTSTSQDFIEGCRTVSG